MALFLCEAYMGLHSQDKLCVQNLFSTPIETKSVLLLHRRQPAFKSDVCLNLSHLQKIFCCDGSSSDAADALECVSLWVFNAYFPLNYYVKYILSTRLPSHAGNWPQNEHNRSTEGVSHLLKSLSVTALWSPVESLSFFFIKNKSFFSFVLFANLHRSNKTLKKPKSSPVFVLSLGQNKIIANLAYLGHSILLSSFRKWHCFLMSSLVTFYHPDSRWSCRYLSRPSIPWEKRESKKMYCLAVKLLHSTSGSYRLWSTYVSRNQVISTSNFWDVSASILMVEPSQL